jgi:hypothetical protein
MKRNAIHALLTVFILGVVAADVGSFSGVSIVSIADGDKVSFDIANVTINGSDITLRDFTIVLVRL